MISAFFPTFVSSVLPIRAMLVLFLVMLPCFHVIAQQRWEPVDMPPCAEVVDIVQSGDTIIAQAEDCWRSEDAGRTWERFAQREDGRLYRAFGRIWSMDIDTLYLYDRAAGWQPVTSPFASYRVKDVCVVGDSVYVLEDSVGKASIWMSDDPSGARWTDITGTLAGQRMECLAARNDGGPRTLICGVANAGVYERLPSGAWRFLSTDQRLRWITRIAHTGREYLASNYEGAILSSTDGVAWTETPLSGKYYINEIAVDGGNVCIATNAALLVSRDGGVTWSREAMNMSHLVATSVDIEGDRIACGSAPHGVFVSDGEGIPWRASNFTDPVRFGKVLIHKGELFIGHSKYETYFRLTPAGFERFNVPSEGSSQPTIFHTIYSDNFHLYYLRYGDSQIRTLSYSDDDGVSWKAVQYLPLAWYCDIAGDGAQVFVTVQGGVARTDNGGGLWTRHNVSMIYEPTLIAAGGGHLYIGAQFELRHSTDGGNTWNGDTLGLPRNQFTHIVCTDSLAVVQVVPYGTYFRRHSDPEFRPVAPGSMNGQIWLRAMHGVGPVLYASDSDGRIHRCDADNSAWESWMDGLPTDTRNTFLGIAGSKAYATDTARVLYSRSIDMVNAVDVPPAAAALDVDVWPQPARELLHVRVAGSGEPADLVLTDLLGREILRRSITTDTSILNIEDLPRGVYRLTVSGASGTTGRNVIKY